MQRLPKPWLCLPLEPSTGFKAGDVGRGARSSSGLAASFPGSFSPWYGPVWQRRGRGRLLGGCRGSPGTRLLPKAPSRSHGRVTVPSPAGSLRCSDPPPHQPFCPGVSGENPSVAPWCKMLVTNSGLGKTVGICPPNPSGSNRAGGSGTNPDPTVTSSG